MQLDNIHSIYFIGIGGIGMSALARYFHARGVRVAGYDRTATALTQALEQEGMSVHYTAQPDRLPSDVDLVVWTPAVPHDFPELLAVRDRGLPLLKRSEVLGIISRGMRTIAIAGTHGKTTTTTLAAYLLHAGGVAANAFLGGIARNFANNYVAGSSDWVVVEADEYDRSFLRLDPDLAVITSMDADHLDIYGDHDSIIETGFLAFADRLKPDGQLIIHHELAHYFSGRPGVLTYGIDAGNYRAHNVRVIDGYFVFDLRTPTGQDINDWRLPQPGRHNVLNTTAALAVALEIGADAEAMRRALPDFRGIGRRFEYVVRGPDTIYIDDYAHHPAEVEATVRAARELYPNRRLTGIFQPHLYTRTRDFAEGFAQALDLLDEPVLLPIYPAREEPIQGVDAAMIFGMMKNPHRRLLTNTELLPWLAEHEPDVLLTMGAGDIDQFINPIREQLLAAKIRHNG